MSFKIKLWRILALLVTVGIIIIIISFYYFHAMTYSVFNIKNICGGFYGKHTLIDKLYTCM